MIESESDRMSGTIRYVTNKQSALYGDDDRSYLFTNKDLHKDQRGKLKAGNRVTFTPKRIGEDQFAKDVLTIEKKEIPKQDPKALKFIKQRSGVGNLGTKDIIITKRTLLTDYEDEDTGKIYSDEVLYYIYAALSKGQVYIAMTSQSINPTSEYSNLNVKYKTTHEAMEDLEKIKNKQKVKDVAKEYKMTIS